MELEKFIIDFNFMASPIHWKKPWTSERIMFWLFIMKWAYEKYWNYYIERTSLAAVGGNYSVTDI